MTLKEIIYNMVFGNIKYESPKEIWHKNPSNMLSRREEDERSMYLSNLIDKQPKKTLRKKIAETSTDLKEDPRTHKQSVETNVDYDKDLSPKMLRAINKSINEAVRIALDKHLKGGSVYYSSSDEEEPKKKGRGRPKNIKLT